MRKDIGANIGVRYTLDKLFDKLFGKKGEVKVK
jgi:hypothetical protein